MKKKSLDKTDLNRPLMMEVGKFLRAKRDEAGISQGEVAKAAKLTSPQFVSNVERGLALPSPGLLNVMLAKYKLDPEEFLELMTSLKMEYYRNLYFPKLKKSNS
jgi:transcriptional regulator with XRE-family HTH domain